MFDTRPVFEALRRAEVLYHETFTDTVPAEAHRFDAFLSTLRMIVDQSADMAPKNLADREQTKEG